MNAHPFLKWAGGKTQILDILREKYPNNKTKYAEPFVGGGAVLFDIIQCRRFEEIYISDSNQRLIDTYQVIRDSWYQLTLMLESLQSGFKDASDKKQFYLEQREKFNETENKIHRAALMIFLNKNCFNGLYRVNRKGDFNVPFAAPGISSVYSPENLKKISELLQPVQIVCGGYDEARDFIDKNTFVYFDPPYRPLTKTANFTAYSSTGFGDEEQIKLAEFVREMSGKGASVIVSNSDPHNVDESDDFFDNLYAGFTIRRVSAKRSINRDGTKRGTVTELLITNF